MITIPNEIVFEEVVKAIANGRKITIPLRGTSMLPTLHECDLVTLAPIDRNRKLNRNNVLLFEYNNNYILHRFHHYEKDIIVTRGDNLYSFEKFPKTNIIAILDSFNNNDFVTDCQSLSWKMMTIKLPLVRFWKYCVRKIKKHLLKH